MFSTFVNQFYKKHAANTELVLPTGAVCTLVSNLADYLRPTCSNYYSLGYVC